MCCALLAVLRCALPAADYFHDTYNKRPENGGQRVVTVLMYLATPEEGARFAVSLSTYHSGWAG
jgi:hypothetical protein